MLIGWLVLLFLALLALNIPVCFVLLIISTVYVFAKDVPLAVPGHLLTTSTDSFILTAIPLFILAAYMMDKGDVSNRIIDFNDYQNQQIGAGSPAVSNWMDFYTQPIAPYNPAVPETNFGPRMPMQAGAQLGGSPT